VSVAWHWSEVTVAAGEPIGQIPLQIAGASTVDLDGDDLVAVDDSGRVDLGFGLEEDPDYGRVRRWRATRATTGPLRVTHRAPFPETEPRPATAPLELRSEGAGFSGAIKCFVVLPPGPDDLEFELNWEGSACDEATILVSSLGEAEAGGAPITGAGLERLADTYVMGGALDARHHRHGDVTMWWLTPPGLDVPTFSERLGETYEILAREFAAPAHPYRVFLRTHPHRGASASAHPASFVMAMNPAQPLDEPKLYETLAHELVHEWLRLDGPDDEVTWFVEGSADYYSLVLPLREGLLDDEAFLRAVNLEARMGYASPRRHLSLAEAAHNYFSDVLAHRLPYVRGMFYLADLDARLRRATSGWRGVDDIVRDVIRLRRQGQRVGLVEWCLLLDDLLPGDERQILDAMVFAGTGRPGIDAFAPRFELTIVEVPVLDLGFDFSTYVTGRVDGLVPGGAADRVGLRDGDRVVMPGYSDALALDVEDALEIQVTRGDESLLVTIQLGENTAPAPQWRFGRRSSA